MRASRHRFLSMPPARTEVSRDRRDQILEPGAPTEFEIQATIWHGLRALGINARGEVPAPFARRATVRFDVAVFEDQALTGIIEVKDGPHYHWDDTRQGSRYLQFGVPVRLVCGLEEAEALLADARRGNLWKKLVTRQQPPKFLTTRSKPQQRRRVYLEDAPPF